MVRGAEEEKRTQPSLGGGETSPERVGKIEKANNLMRGPGKAHSRKRMEGKKKKEESKGGLGGHAEEFAEGSPSVKKPMETPSTHSGALTESLKSRNRHCPEITTPEKDGKNFRIKKETRELKVRPDKRRNTNEGKSYRNLHTVATKRTRTTFGALGKGSVALEEEEEIKTAEETKRPTNSTMAGRIIKLRTEKHRKQEPQGKRKILNAILS